MASWTYRAHPTTRSRSRRAHDSSRSWASCDARPAPTSWRSVLPCIPTACACTLSASRKRDSCYASASGEPVAARVTLGRSVRTRSRAGTRRPPTRTSGAGWCARSRPARRACATWRRAAGRSAANLPRRARGAHRRSGYTACWWLWASNPGAGSTLRGRSPTAWTTAPTAPPCVNAGGRVRPAPRAHARTARRDRPQDEALRVRAQGSRHRRL